MKQRSMTLAVDREDDLVVSYFTYMFVDSSLTQLSVFDIIVLQQISIQ